MTAKHKHEEYATQKKLEESFWNLVILVLVVLVASVVLSWANRPTLTQPAEAEGWEIECVEWRDMQTITLTCDQAGIIQINSDPNYYKPVAEVRYGKSNCSLSDIHNTTICTTYALRRHEP